MTPPRATFGQGLSYALRGYSLVARPSLRRYVVVPILLNLVLFAVLGGGAAWAASSVIDALAARLPDGVQSVAATLLWLFVGAGFVVVALQLFVVTAGLVGGPFYARMAQVLEAELRGAPLVDEGGVGAILREIGWSVPHELRKLAYFARWGIPLFILSFVPIVQLVVPPLALVYGAWVLALESLDFPMANHHVAFVDQRRRLQGTMPRTLGFGLPAFLASLVPGLNLLALPAAVAGATAFWVEVLQPGASNGHAAEELR